MRVADISTPAPLIDLDIAERNLHRVIGTCHSNHVGYRPHIKTHKMPVLAHMQVRAGALGITCAKLGEGEVMARAGLDDIFIAYCLVGRSRFDRLAQLGSKHQLRVGVDSKEAALGLSEFFSAQGQAIDVLLEIDTGHHRCGVLPEHAVEFATYLNSLPSIQFKGIFTHEGHLYQPGPQTERMARAGEAGRQMVSLAFQLSERRVAVGVVSVGSSPARYGVCQVKGVTEHRPGTNIFNDCTQVQLGACDWSDCALTYECTVVSRPALDRAIIDGGSKTFSSDQLSDWPDVGRVQSNPTARFSKASEEHGFLYLPDRMSQGLQIGDRVRVIPSHACGSINLHERVYCVRGSEIVDEWRIEARGCVD